MTDDEDTLAELWKETFDVARDSTPGREGDVPLDPSWTYPAPESSDAAFAATFIEPGLPNFSFSAESGVDVHARTLLSEDPEGSTPVGVPAPTRPAAAESLYRLEEVIGEGGMGVVYRARQSSLGRDVAVKAVRPAKSRRVKVREKFLAEAVMTGRLDHPNIVPVYDLGLSGGGEAVLAMKLVEGTSWKALLHPHSDAERARAEAMGLADHLRILLSVCNAVAFAHSRGIVHNDLKPENVMLGEFGEVFVMDWGLAVDVRDDPPPDSDLPHKSGLTHPCGTPSYMAPELARGRGEDLGPWTDVYLLGAILHEILTGQPPHRGDSIHAVVVKAALSPPPELPADTPPELRAICARAMSKAPADRYPDVARLRAAVEGFLAHRESQRIARAARTTLDRARGAQLAAAPAGDEARNRLYADFAEAVAGFAQALVLWEENPAARAGEREARLAYARAALARDDLGLAEAQLAKVPADAAGRDDLAAGLRDAHAARERARRQARLLRGALGVVTAGLLVGLSVGYFLVSAARDRAEAHRATAEANAAEAREEHARAEAERARAEEARQEAERRLAQSLVATGDTLGAGGRWDEARARYAEALASFARRGESALRAELGLLVAEERSPSPLLEFAGPARRLAFAPDGRRLVVGEIGGGLSLWDALLGRRLRVFRPRGPELRALCVAPDGSWVAAGDAEGGLAIWELDGGTLRHQLVAHPGGVTCLAPTRESRELLSGGEDGALYRWDVVSGEKAVTYAEDPKTVGPVAAGLISPSGTYAFTLTRAGGLTWWNRGGSVHWGFGDSAPGSAGSIAFAPERAEFVLAAADRTIRVWPFHEPWNNYKEQRRLVGHTGAIRDLAYAPEGDRLLSVGLDGRLRLWDPQTGESLGSVAARGEGLTCLSVSPDGRRVAAGGLGAPVQLWDLGLATRNPSGAERSRVALELRGDLEAPRDEEQEAEAQPSERRWSAAALAPGGQLAATGDAEGALTLWDAHSGAPLLTRPWHRRPLVALSFSPTGDRLFSASREGLLRVWDTNGLVPAMSWDVEGELAGAALSRDGRRIVAGTVAGTLHVFDPTQEAGLRSFAAEQGRLGAVAVGPRGEQALAGGEDGSLALWTLGASPRRLLLAEAGGAGISCAAILPAGKQALVGRADGGLALWDLEVGTRLRALGGHDAAVTRVAAFAGDELGVSAGADGSWRLWELSSGSELRSFAEGAGAVEGLGLAPDARRVLVAGGRCRLWDLERASLQAGRWGDAVRAAQAVLADDPSDRAAREVLARWYAFRGSFPSALDLWDELPPGDSALERARLLTHWELGHHHAARRVAVDLAEGEPDSAWLRLVGERLREEQDRSGTRLGREPDRVHALAFAPDGARLLTSSDAGELQLWAAPSGRRLRVFREHRGGILACAFSPSGRRIASGDRNGLVLIGSPEASRPEQRIEAHRGYASELAFVDEDRLLSLGSDKQVRLWRLSGEGAPAEVFAGEKRQHAPRALAVSPDRARFAIGDVKGRIEVWELAGPTLVHGWEGDPQRINHLAFAPGGQLVSYGSRQPALKVWHPADGSLLREWPGAPDSPYGFALSGDGRRVVLAGNRGHLVVLDLSSGQSLASWREEFILLSAAIDRTGERVAAGTIAGHLILRELPRAE